jgi:hypothetical protein
VGAFLISAGASDAARSQALHQLGKAGFTSPTRLSAKDLEIIVFPRKGESEIEAFAGAEGDFALGIGVMLFRGEMGRKALELAFESFDGTADSLSEAIGQFAFVIKKNETICIINDDAGLMPIYLDKESGLISSSFLALAAARAQHPRVSRSAAQFWCGMGG